MSDPVTALNGRVAQGEVIVRDGGLQGMITVRGDFSNATFRKACTDVTGQAFPEPRQANVADGKGLCWMSPDELLLLVPYEKAKAAVTMLEKGLAKQHALVADVSDARCYVVVEGAGAGEVLAKNAPVDLHNDRFQSGDFRRSRMGQVAAAFWKDADGAFHVIAFRSVADYVFNLLATSAKDGRVGVLVS